MTVCPVRCGKWRYILLIGVMVFGTLSCTGSTWNTLPAEAQVHQAGVPLIKIFKPDPEDISFFRAIAERQDEELQSCKSQVDCQKPHFLRGLVSLYTDKNLAAPHFRKVITAKPSSRLASESRFWLWYLEVLNKQDDDPQVSTADLMRRLTREMVDREFMVHDLASKLEHTSIEALQQDVDERDKKVEELNQVVASLTKQITQLKKEPAIRQSLQKELDASEKKVEELLSQLEALRRIDQELKEKTPPTRPSEKMTPTAEVEQESPK